MTENKTLLGGLDIGTSGCKLSVYDTEGNYICNEYRTYEVSRLAGKSEIDAREIFSAVCEVIRTVAAACSLTAVGVTSFGETFAAVDAEGEVLFPSMLYTDPRGERECLELTEKLTAERLTRITGVKPHSMYSLPKILWLKKNRPDVFSRVKRILLMQDYVVYRLTGSAQIDCSLAARTMALDIREKRWSREILDAAGLDASLFSTPVPSGTAAGFLRPELAAALGVKKPFAVVSGAHDQVASALGAGALDEGDAVDGTGTVECVVPVFRSIPSNPRLFYDEGYSVVPYAADGTYVSYAFSYTGGAVLKWYRDRFAGELAGRKDAYAVLDAQVPEAPTSILVLPHFSGAATPYMDNASKAAVIGLTLEHTGADLYKALMEGVTYEIMMNIECLENAGVTMNRLLATGGGAASDTWLQIKADILGRPIVSLKAKEAGASGTCMLCGVALGIFRDLAEAKAVFVKERRTFVPDAARFAVYRKRYAAYRRLYKAVRPLMEESRCE